MKTHSIESRCVTGPENTPFAVASMQLSVRKYFTGWGREGVNPQVNSLLSHKRHSLPFFFCSRRLYAKNPIIPQRAAVAARIATINNVLIPVNQKMNTILPVLYCNNNNNKK